jgi:hypothetical protein
VTDLISELARRVAGIDETRREAFIQQVLDHPSAGLPWAPTAGPQREAYRSLADELLYGGQAGGGKSGLLVGLALTRHRNSLLMRRQYSDLGSLIEDCLEKHGSRKGFSGSPPARLRLPEGGLIDFGAAKDPGDEQHWKGRPHDLLGIDEASQWLESQVRFLMGWVRSTDPGQRCRVVLATNPPEQPGEGGWLMEMFGPWLDKTHPLYPARPGELLWYVSDEEGQDMWVDGPEEVEVGDRMMKPTSRTFIGAALKDNPFLRDTGYSSRLDALPEPLRSAVRDGNWMISHKDHRWQIIPTNWALAAQERWTREPPKGSPMCAIGVDVAQGGDDRTVLQPRYDYWFAEPIVVPGIETPLGSDVGALVVKHRRNQADVIIDMGGGYGSGVYEHLQSNIETSSEKAVYGFNGSHASAARTKDRLTTFYNKRAEVWWRFREALDPDQEGGSPIALPPDAGLVSELVSAQWEPTPRGIKVEDKEKIIKRLGHSPDKADALVMAWSVGPTWLTHHKIWKDVSKNAARRPRVMHGYEQRKRRRRHK